MTDAIREEARALMELMNAPLLSVSEIEEKVAQALRDAREAGARAERERLMDDTLCISHSEAEALKNEIERLKVWASDSHIQDVDQENARLRAALEGFSKCCIKPECRCWACEALGQ